LLDVFESTKDLVTMERAALFKKKNYSKLISDVSIVTESNHKRVVDILCSIFQDVLMRPTTAVDKTWNMEHSGTSNNYDNYEKNT